MSAITNTPFSASSMNATDVVSSEAKGKKSGGGKPKNGPKKPFMIKGPIPPEKFRDPDIIYAETNPPGLPPGQRPWDKKKNDFSESEGEAIKKALRWKSRSVYNAYAEKARGSSSSGKSGPVTYDGGKVMARGSSSDVGSKSTAVYSTGVSKNSCTIS